MKLHQEDPRLTAYLLGELPPEEAAAVARAVAADPALRISLAETEKAQLALFGALGGEKESLLPRQRENIRRAAKEAARRGKIERLRSHRNVPKAWTVPLAAAAVIGAGIFILTQIPSGKSGPGGKPVTGNQAPKTGEGSGAEPGVEPDSENITRLPLQAGRKSLPLISDAVRTEGRMPTKDEVRIPELLNAFPLRANSAVALWNGCKLGTEALPCPWKPSGSLILVEIQGAKDGPRELSVEFRADADSVITHRLLGYASASGGGVLKPLSEISANSSMILVIEVEAKTTQLGNLTWTVGGEDAPPVALVRDNEREPSDDARFASLICAFGLWLRGEDSTMVDDALVLGIAREVAAESMAADRYDFLNLVDQAMKLSGR